MGKFLFMCLSLTAAMALPIQGQSPMNLGDLLGRFPMSADMDMEIYVRSPEGGGESRVSLVFLRQANESRMTAANDVVITVNDERLVGGDGRRWLEGREEGMRLAVGLAVTVDHLESVFLADSMTVKIGAEDYVIPGAVRRMLREGGPLIPELRNMRPDAGSGSGDSL